MKIEHEIKQLREDYLDVSIPADARENVWRGVENEISSPSSLFHLKRGIVVAAFILLLFGGTIGVAQASKPGDVLYPVKETTDKIVESISHQVEEINMPVFEKVEPTPKAEAEGEDKNKAVEEKKVEKDEKAEANVDEKVNYGETRSSEVREDNPSNSNNAVEQVLEEVRGVSEEVRGDREAKEDAPGQNVSEEKREENKPLLPKLKVKLDVSIP